MSVPELICAKKANAMLHTFTCFNPLVKTYSVVSIWLCPMYVFFLWAQFIRSHIKLCSKEDLVAIFNCCTASLHLVAGLFSLRNVVVILRSWSPTDASLKSNSPVLPDALYNAGYNFIMIMSTENITLIKMYSAPSSSQMYSLPKDWTATSLMFYYLFVLAEQ